MGSKGLYLIDKKEGMNEEFGKLLSMMDYTRMTTVAEVKNLTAEQLDFLVNEETKFQMKSLLGEL